MTKEQTIKELAAMANGYCTPTQRDAIAEAIKAVEKGAETAKDIWEVSLGDAHDKRTIGPGSIRRISKEKEVRYILVPVGSAIETAMESAKILARQSSPEDMAVCGVRHLGMGRLPR